jgi:3-deoxy-manno-octulosonate cytidylyltransferase (CMP-KDO synthetase)
MPTALPTAIVLIPARMSASRLPGKPLADIHGAPMIVHVWRRAVEAAVGRVVVATDDLAIAAAVELAGGEAVMTRADHLNGSARIHEALLALRSDAEIVVNLQGDLPTVDPASVRAALSPLADPGVAIGTICAKIVRDDERSNPNVVKVVGAPATLAEEDAGILRVLYFTRATAPWGPGLLWHHIGLYAYRREALDRYVALPPSVLEQREKLEQLRALEAGMRIDAAIVDAVPLGVDTPDDLARARQLLPRKALPYFVGPGPPQAQPGTPSRIERTHRASSLARFRLSACAPAGTTMTGAPFVAAPVLRYTRPSPGELPCRNRPKSSSASSSRASRAPIPTSPSRRPTRGPRRSRARPSRIASPP